MINGHYYNNGEQLYFCPELFPIIVTAVTQDSMPITDTSAIWSAGEGTIDAIYGDHSVIRINENGLNNEDEVAFSVAIDQDGLIENIGITIKKITKLELDIKESEKHKKYSFDDNKIKQYPYYGDGKPYKFMAYNQSDTIIIKADHINKLKMANFKPMNKFNYTASTSKVLNIEHTGNTVPDSVYVIACDTIKQFKADIYQEKTLHVNIYTLAETDDDIANYCISDRNNDGKIDSKDSIGYFKPDCVTRIDSKNWECVLPGPDGSLDLFNSQNHWKRKDNNTSKAIDSIFVVSNQQLHTMKIFAGNDKFCNARPLPRDTADYPAISSGEITEIENNLNTIYNQVGINVVVHNKGTLFTNFDNYKDDNKIDSTNLGEEQQYFHVMTYGDSYGNYVKLDTTTVFFVKDMLKVNGRATGSVKTINGNYSNLGNTSIIDHGTYNERTIAHEIGHGKFYLFHPDENKTIGQKALVKNDVTNFMNSGTLYFNNGYPSIEKHIVRRYQWKLIYKYY